MLKTTIKGLLARKFRLVTTGLAVLLGVAFMVGTLVLTDTIEKTFDELFATVSAGTDAHVRSNSAIETGDGFEVRARIPDVVLDDVVTVDEVAAAEGEIEGYAQIVGTDGDAVGNPSGGAPTFGRNWTTDDELNPFDIVDGRPPEADGEVVIDKFTAEQGDLGVGDRTDVITTDPEGGQRRQVTPVVVVGLARFGDTDSPGGSTNVMFQTAVAQRLVAEEGRFDAINVRGEEGLSEAQVRDAVAAAVPTGVEVLTGAEITEEDQDAIAEGIGFFSTFLLVFAVIALFVGTFIIYNTFTILLAQRTREMALLRAVGASRAQVLWSVVLEAVVVGLVAAALGLVVGVGVAAGLRALLDVIGLDIPSGGLVITTATVVTSFVVGLVVSVVSAIVPALRASRIPPVAAMRDLAVDRPRSVVRLVIGAIVTVVGAVLVAVGLLGEVDNAILAVGVGALALVIGVAVLGPLFAGPFSLVLGSPLPRLRGIAGGLARQNAARNPSRTSTTAAALMIGVTLVAFITVTVASLKASFASTLESNVRGDFVLDSGQFGPGAGLPTGVAEAARQLPEVDSVASVRFLGIEIEGGGEIVGAINPDVKESLFDVGLVAGAYADLDETGIAVHESKAEELGLALDDPVPVRFVETGEQELRVRAIYEDDDLVGDWFVGIPLAEANVPDQFDFQVYIDLAPDVTAEEGRAALERVIADVPTAELQNQQEFRDAQTAQLDPILALVYALLFFSVWIALIGIANTLALSVFERTREIGLLRAVGMTRSQVRSMVRWESVIVALLGTVLGLVLGTGFGWALITANADEGLNTLSIPVGQLAIIALIAGLAGVWAARRPAKRAAKLDVLQAISTT